MDPTVGPTSPAFRNEIRSVYRIAGEAPRARDGARCAIVTGSGRLEHPIAGSDADVPPDVRPRAVGEPRRVRRREPPLAAPQRRDLQPRRRRGGHPQRPVARRRPTRSTTTSSSFRRCIRSARATRDSSCAGNPTNDAIYTIPGEYLYSPQHPASLYRMNVRYETVEHASRAGRSRSARARSGPVRSRS